MPLSYKERIKRITAANVKYQKKALRLFSFRFHKVNDADVIAHLELQENLTDYIRQLVRGEIKKGGGK